MPRSPARPGRLPVAGCIAACAEAVREATERAGGDAPEDVLAFASALGIMAAALASDAGDGHERLLRRRSSPGFPGAA